MGLDRLRLRRRLCLLSASRERPCQLPAGPSFDNGGLTATVSVPGLELTDPSLASDGTPLPGLKASSDAEGSDAALAGLSKSGRGWDM